MSNLGNLTLHPDNGEVKLPGPIVVLGEVLWDVFPESLQLGGAPLNFAAHVKRLGRQAILISAIGNDELGEKAARDIAELGLPIDMIHRSAIYGTGRALVSVGEGGQADFQIVRPAAYDDIRLSATELKALVELKAAWLYYGTLLASRKNGMATLKEIWKALPHAARFCDINLRAGFDSNEVVSELLSAADVVKLNESEAHVVSGRFDLPRDLCAFCCQGAERFGWRAVAVTLAERGCVIFDRDEFVAADGHAVNVADTVGAGDAFSAAFLHGLIEGWPAARIASFANRVGALVASRPGAIPEWHIAETAAL